MKVQRRVCLCWWCLLILVLWLCPQREACAAAEPAGLLGFSLEPSTARPGETLRLSVSARETCDPAGFRLQINYDTARLALERVEASGQLNGNMATNGSANPVCSVYVCGVSGASAPQLSGTLVSYVFRVRENAAPGTAPFLIRADQFCDYSGSSLPLYQEESLEAEMLAPLSNAAVLESLKPSMGTLEPPFSPNRYQYALAVDSTVNDVTFEAQAAQKGSVSVSRHRLNRAGEETPITITVTSQDGKTRVPYLVIVDRAAEEAPPSNSTPAELTSLVPSYGSLEPAFSKEITQYALRVPAQVDDVTFEAAAAQGGSVSVSRHKLNRAGTETPITVTVTSSDGKSKAVYTVIVYRAEAEPSSQTEPPDVYLTALVPSYGSLEPAFSKEITQYALRVPAQVDDVTFEAAAAQGGSVSVSRHKLNRAGTETPITITVTSSDGKSKAVYTVIVYRAEAEPSSQTEPPDVYLTALVPSYGSLEPAFSKEITQYALRVPAQVDDVTFEAAASIDASILVSRHKLNRAGTETPITVTVTSSDGKARQLYTVTVFRAEAAASSQRTGAVLSRSSKESASRTPAGASPGAGQTGSTPEEEAYTPQPPSGVTQAEGELLSLPTEPLLVRKDRFSAFFSGLLAAVLCLIAVFLLVFYRAKRKKNFEGKAPDPHEKKAKNQK